MHLEKRSVAPFYECKGATERARRVESAFNFAGCQEACLENAHVCLGRKMRENNLQMASAKQSLGNLSRKMLINLVNMRDPNLSKHD